ncbi:MULTISPECIES: hypothetical protein [unclassified Bradyrhizobium]|uniref:hypothetical protein n=1 Tax=unclassified Bradyrhizobium TaxID=2631580 RepID=UPI0020B2FC5C|nr:MULTISPECIES: hypothetical protein [unclassified Bradyrhizobium]MCP3443492.1 hypothetical protein [Bradyrhizobium sp. CCGUVB14]WFU77959.1 hypothetical protein QA645_25815 [Bradyrhizobium sp. CIAT3101]
MLRFQQVAVALQYAPGFDGTLLMQRCDHAIDGVVELPDKAPCRCSHDDLLST